MMKLVLALLGALMLYTTAPVQAGTISWDCAVSGGQITSDVGACEFGDNNSSVSVGFSFGG